MLRYFGPVLSLGRPGELRTPLGASRIYLPHDQWQPLVSLMMREARLVVMFIGGGAGFAWELNEAFRIIPRQRIVLLLPSFDEGRDVLGASLGLELSHIALPRHKRGNWSYQWINGCVCFERDGRPVYRPLPWSHIHDVGALVGKGIRPGLRRVGVRTVGMGLARSLRAGALFWPMLPVALLAASLWRVVRHSLSLS
jgi:hypothetical protein